MLFRFQNMSLSKKTDDFYGFMNNNYKSQI